MSPAPPGALARLALLLCASLLCAGCLPVHVKGSRLERERTVPLQVHILSEPPGALVRDGESGEALGRTPIEMQPLALVFEEWTAVNDDTALRSPARPGETDGYLAVSLEPDGEPRVMQGEPIVLRYLLTLDGYAPREASWTLDPADLPELEKHPVVTLIVRLQRTGSTLPSGR